MPAVPLKRHIAYIDGLRALAVVAVMLFHFEPDWLPGGFAGVDVFFVISGFVVSGALAARAALPFAEYASVFYARRVRRLLPALLVFLTATAIMATLFIPRAWLSQSTDQTARAAFVGLSNIVLANHDGYFSPKTEYNPYAHTWSLGIEEQFYLLFPVLFFLAVSPRLSDRSRRRGLALMGALIAASLTYVIFATDDKIYYSSLGRFWEIGSGVALFMFFKSSYAKTNETFLRSWFGSKLARLASIAMIIAGFIFSDPRGFPYPWGLLPVLGTLTLMTSLHFSPAFLGRVLGSRAMVYVGNISYSLYLWHWGVFVFFRWTVGMPPQSAPYIPIVLTILLALASYHLIEQPVRENLRIDELSAKRVLITAAAAVILCLSVALTLFHFQPNLSLSVTRHRSLWYTDDAPVAIRGCEPVVSSQRFGHNSSQEYLPGPCTKTKSSIHIFVLGDSHAFSYRPLFHRLAIEHGVHVSLYGDAGCELFRLAYPAAYRVPACIPFVAASLDDIYARAKSGDILFLPGLKIKRFADQPDDSVKPVTHPPFSQAEIDALGDYNFESTSLPRFEKKGVTIVIEAPKPIFRAQAFRCSDWFNKDNPMCRAGLSVDRSELEKIREPAMTVIKRMTQSGHLIKVWDPLPVLCPESKCVAMTDRGPLFFDGDHLSHFGNDVLLSDFVSKVLSAKHD